MTESHAQRRPAQVLCLVLLLACGLAAASPVAAQGPDAATTVSDPGPAPAARVITPPDGGRGAGTPAGGPTLGSTLFSLALVLGLLFVTLLLLRRSTPNLRGVAPTGAMQVLERQSLDARTQLYLVRCLDRILVLGVSANGVTTLASLDATAEQLAQFQPGDTHVAEQGGNATLPWPWVSKALAAIGGHAA
ncbi:MAG: flagellar biosynthetic protein FliO [Planctomycetaceae bacterium]